MPPMPLHISLQTMDETGEEVEGEVEVEGAQATLRFPRKTKAAAKEEEEIVVPVQDNEGDEMPILPPDQPQMG